MRPKAKALGYLEAKTATNEQKQQQTSKNSSKRRFPSGMTNKKGRFPSGMTNKKGKSKNDSSDTA
jgi:hypothetical protein